MESPVNAHEVQKEMSGHLTSENSAESNHIKPTHSTDTLTAQIISQQVLQRLPQNPDSELESKPPSYQHAIHHDHHGCRQCGICYGHRARLE